MTSESPADFSFAPKQSHRQASFNCGEQSHGDDYCLCVFAASKPELNKLFEARQVIQFAEFYPVGHRSTNYKKFFESDVPYPIKFKSGYEPYVLVSRKHMPWYDERFRGYGWDKVSPRLSRLAGSLLMEWYRECSA